MVRTPSNFGQLGERPSHPELLDYLAARFVENKWSLKALHREIMLSSTYSMSGQYSAEASEADPENRLLWHFPSRRLSAEALRDSLLAISGLLDRTAGGPAERLNDDNLRRTVYGYVSRKKLDPMLSLFDFPNPNNTSEARIATDVPLQRLFLLNSGLMMKAAEAAAQRTEREVDARRRIEAAYRLVFARKPSAAELKLGLEYVASDTWPRYLQVLMSLNEFLQP